MLTYSQNAEDLRLKQALGDVTLGTYIDIGAADPDINSVTQLFYDDGWRGVNVEPGPKFARLAQHRSEDRNLQLAVGASDASDVVFYVTHPYSDLSSLIAPDPDALGDLVQRVEEVRVPTRSLVTILDEAMIDTIHFMKVDVEGAEAEVLQSNDWSRHRPWIVLVEAIEAGRHALNYSTWESILLDAGYVFAYFDGINRFYVENGQLHRVDLLAKPIWPIAAIDVFEHRQLIEAAMRDEVEREMNESALAERSRLLALSVELQSQIQRAERAAEEFARENAELHRELMRLDHELALMTRERHDFAERVSELDAAVAATRRSVSYRVGNAFVHPAASAARRARSLATSKRSPAEPSLLAITPQESYDAFVAPGRAWHFPLSQVVERGTISTSIVPAEMRAPRRADDERIVTEIRNLDRHTEAAATSGFDFDERRAIGDLELLMSARLGQRVAARSWADERVDAVVVDVRCFQDPTYAERGVGHHASAVFEALRAHFPDRLFVGLVAADRPIGSHRLLKDLRLVYSAAQARDVRPRCVVSLSPLTATPAPMLPFLQEPGVRALAIIYDFIPAEFPAAYLASDASALAYFAGLASLEFYDTFLPISKDVQTQLARRLDLGDRDVFVTGVSSTVGSAVRTSTASSRVVVVPVGGDPRKNPLAAVGAVALARRNNPSLRLVVIGRMTDLQLADLGTFAESVGLNDEHWTHHDYLSHDDLDAAFRNAACVVVPSFAEGYSIPVAHALAFGTPVVASDIAVHRELAASGVVLVQPNDIVAMAAAINAAVAGERPAGIAIHDAERVARQVERALQARPIGTARVETKVAISHSRPRLAVVTPLPPEATGIADYSAFTFSEVAKHVDLTVFAPHPVTTIPGSVSEEFDARAFDGDRFDATLVVMGNSHFHFSALDFVEHLGTPVLAHDTRMTESYLADRGPARLSRYFDSNGESSAVSLEAFELDESPRTFDTLARVGSPLIVHSRCLADYLGQRFGSSPSVVPFVPYRMPGSPVTAEVIVRCREALGFDPNAFHIGLVGIVDRRTKLESLTVQAAGWMNQWGAKTVVHLIGPASRPERDHLAWVASVSGCTVRFHGRVPDQLLDTTLLALDAGVQIRSSERLSISGAYTDLLAFGVPTVASAPILVDHGSTGYTRSLPVDTTALLLAEQLDHLRNDWNRLGRVQDIEVERTGYLADRTVAAYARGLLDALGLAV
jgi:FkbM family methyltransferase